MKFWCMCRSGPVQAQPVLQGMGHRHPFPFGQYFPQKKKIKLKKNLHQYTEEPMGPGNGQTVTSCNVLRCTSGKQGFLQALWRRWCCSDRVMVIISFWPLACDYHFTSRCPSAVSKQCSLQWHCYCCWKMEVNKGSGHIHRATGFYKYVKIHNF